MVSLIKYYRKPGIIESQIEASNFKIKSVLSKNIMSSLSTEVCYYIQADAQMLSSEEESILKWLLSVPFEEHKLSSKPSLQEDNNSILIEIGPRLNFSTAFSTNSVAICHSFGFTDIHRIELSTRYLLVFNEGSKPSREEEDAIVAKLHDRMTCCRYKSPLTSFNLNVDPEPIFEVDIIGEGQKALEKANKDLGLAFDAWDIDYYTKLFQKKVKRNPTNVECFDLAQSNSEHSRHWFFKGRLVVDGKEWPQSLFKMIMDTQLSTNDNNVIKFNDNSSAIQGFPLEVIEAENAAGPGKFSLETNRTRHIIFTAETHNFPTGVAPFPGATTGTGGRIRDVQATGRGAHVVIGTAGYSFGALNIPGYNLPWEDTELEYPPNLARPLEVAVEASNGASDYGNKFGEPVLCGFARSCCLVTPSGDRREYVKPIMFSGGLGMMDARHVNKDKPEKCEPQKSTILCL